MVHIPVQRVQFLRVMERFPYFINPYDFQHEHFPECITAEDLEHRRLDWNEGQLKAVAVMVLSRQTQADASNCLGIPGERVFYAPYMGRSIGFPNPMKPGFGRRPMNFPCLDGLFSTPPALEPRKNHLALVNSSKKSNRCSR